MDTNQSSLTIAQQAVQKSFATLNVSQSASGYTILVPSKEFEAFGEKRQIPKPKAGGALNLLNWGLEIYKNIDRGSKSERIDEVKDAVRKQMNQKDGPKTQYDLRFSINGDNEVDLRSMIPHGKPQIGYDSNYIDDFKITLDMNMPTDTNPDYVTEQLNITEEKLNAPIKTRRDIEQFERDIPHFAERALERMNEYRDPPSDDDLADTAGLC